MDRKIKILIITCALFLLLPCASVYADTPYKGTISSTYINYFKDMAVNVGFDDDYVLYRSSDTDYTMVVGDLDYENYSFMGTSCHSYTIKNVNIGGYNTTYHSFTESNIVNFSLDCGDYLVYSNLGGYPDIMTEEGYYAKIKIIVICIVVLCLFIGRIFAFVLRKSR